MDEMRRERRVASCIFYSLAILSLSESESERDEKERDIGGSLVEMGRDPRKRSKKGKVHLFIFFIFSSF